MRLIVTSSRNAFRVLFQIFIEHSTFPCEVFTGGGRYECSILNKEARYITRSRWQNAERQEWANGNKKNKGVHGARSPGEFPRGFKVILWESRPFKGRRGIEQIFHDLDGQWKSYLQRAAAAPLKRFKS